MGFFDKLKNKKQEKMQNAMNSQEVNGIDLTIPENVKEFVKKQIADLMEEETQLRDNSVLVPKWNVSIYPDVQQVDERGVVLDLYIKAPQWGKSLYECSVGMGNDPQSNIGLALGSFIFAFMKGIAAMENEKEGIALTTSFSEKTHKWNVYKTDIVGIGKNENFTDVDTYWNALKEDIKKRLGNQKLCYVKIFGSKMGDDVIGECRIDDVVSPELSKKVADIVSKWQVEGFVSQKQFFFIRQEESTTLSYPYEGEEGFQLLKDKVALAAKMFHESDTEELYQSLPERLGEALQDEILGIECFSFLPEICTEHAFSEATYSEKVNFAYPSGSMIEVYKSQLADYELLKRAILTVFHEGTLGELTDDIYREYIGSSATYSVFAQMQEKGSDLKDASTVAIAFSVDEDFEIR